MSQILLLTKCIQAEQQIENEIKLLGHEIFCSTITIDQIVRQVFSDIFLKRFEIVILSETVPNYEIDNILKVLDTSKQKVIQKVTRETKKKEKQENIKNEIHCIIPISPTTEVLREVLASSSDIKKVNATFDKYAFNEIIYDLPFTKKEQEVVKELLEADGKPVPREQLCKVVFNKSDTNSAKSQLSSMVKKIKIKLSEEKMDYVCLKTVWGSGYQLIFRK